MVRSLGLAAVSMAGLLVLANSGPAQERREGATRREGEARQGEARQGEARQGEARRDEGRAGSISRCQSSGVTTNKADSGTAYGSLGNISDKALISVKVPANAEIKFDDFKTTQTGAARQFITPALEGKGDFSYEIHAHWMEGDKPIDQTRKVTVRAGGRATIDFTAPASEGPEARQEDIAAPKRGEAKPQAKQEEKPLAKPEEKPQAKQEEKPLAKPEEKPKAKQEQKPQAKQEEKPQAKEEKPLAKQEEKQPAAKKTHEGQVVSFNNHELVMKGSDGKEHNHTLANDAKVTIDGKPAKAEDLKANMKIEVTTKEGDPKTAVRIEAHSK
jgi:uncharacterized protein (TIGR03000 family)